jgi:hypothetical protein
MLLVFALSGQHVNGPAEEPADKQVQPLHELVHPRLCYGLQLMLVTDFFDLLVGHELRKRRKCLYAYEQASSLDGADRGESKGAGNMPVPDIRDDYASEEASQQASGEAEKKVDHACMHPGRPPGRPESAPGGMGGVWSRVGSPEAF